MNAPETTQTPPLTGCQPLPGAAKKKCYVAPALQKYGGVRQFTQGTGGANGDGGPGMMVLPSDRALKENIARIGEHPLGIGLYLFDYKPEFRDWCGHGRQFGVMAQEVEAVMPEAVSTHPDGYKRVNYAMLEITRSVH